MTLSDKVFDYVHRNPGARYPKLAEDLGMSLSHARSCLARLENQGRLSSKKTNTRARAYHPATEDTITQALLRRASKFSGPFSILVAQVAR
jgi:predicted transcriptional regulator